MVEALCVAAPTIAAARAKTGSRLVGHVARAAATARVEVGPEAERTRATTHGPAHWRVTMRTTKTFDSALLGLALALAACGKSGGTDAVDVGTVPDAAALELELPAAAAPASAHVALPAVPS